MKNTIERGINRNAVLHAVYDKPTEDENSRLCCMVDFTGGTILLKDGIVFLPNMEKRLLLYLYEHPDRVVTKEELLGYVWEYKKHLPKSYTIVVHVNRVRKKLNCPDSKNGVIKKVYGHGYVFDSSYLSPVILPAELA